MAHGTAKWTTATGMTNEQLSYGYTETGLLDTFGGTGAFIADTEFDAFGRPVSRTRGNVVGKPFFDTREYDAATGRLTRHHVSLYGVATSAADYRHTYNGAGDITMSRDLNAAGTLEDTQCFQYDHLRRLTQARTSDDSDCAAAPTTSNLGDVDPYWSEFEYSAGGNRTEWVERVGTGSSMSTRTHEYSYPAPSADQPHAVDEVTTTGDDPQSESFAYDGTGAMIERHTDPDVGRDLVYDVEGHLVSATDKDSGDVTEFVYDADGNRLVQHDQAAGTSTLYAGAAEYTRDDASGLVTPVRHYSLGGEAVAVRTVAGGLRHLVADGQGTATIQVDAATSSYAKRRYGPFGLERNPVGAHGWDGDRGFLNKTKDGSLGTTHLDGLDPLLWTSDCEPQAH